MLVVLTCTKLTTKMLEGYKCEVSRAVDKLLLTLSFEELFMYVAQTSWDESHMSCNNVGALVCTHTSVVNTAECVSNLLCFCYRLKEIEMSEYDATTYDRFSGAVRRQVQSLRIILDSLQVNTSSSPTPAVSGLKTYWFYIQ